MDRKIEWFQFTPHLSYDEQQVIMSLNYEWIVFLKMEEKFFLGFHRSYERKIVELLQEHKINFFLSEVSRSETMKILKITTIMWPKLSSNIHIQQGAVTCTSKTVGFAYYHITPTPKDTVVVNCGELNREIYKEFVIVVCDKSACENIYCSRNEKYTTIQSICPEFKKPSNEELVGYIMENGWSLSFTSSNCWCEDKWLMEWTSDDDEVIGRFKPYSNTSCDFGSRVMRHIRNMNRGDLKKIRKEFKEFKEQYVRLEKMVSAPLFDLYFQDVYKWIYDTLYFMTKSWSVKSFSDEYYEFDEFIDSIDYDTREKFYNKYYTRLVSESTFEGMIWIKYPIQNYVEPHHVSDCKFIEYKLFEEVIWGFEPYNKHALYHLNNIENFEFIDTPPFHEKMEIIKFLNTSIKNVEYEIDNSLDRDFFEKLQVLAYPQNVHLLLNCLVHYNIDFLLVNCKPYGHMFKKFFKSIVVVCDHEIPYDTQYPSHSKLHGEYCSDYNGRVLEEGKYRPVKFSGLSGCHNPEKFYKSFRHLSVDEIKQTILNTRSFGFEGDHFQTFSYEAYPPSIIPDWFLRGKSSSGDESLYPKHMMSFSKTERSRFDTKMFMIDFLNDLPEGSCIDDLEKYYKDGEDYPILKVVDFIYNTLFQILKDLKNTKLSPKEFDQDPKNFSFVIEGLESIYEKMYNIHYKCGTDDKILRAKHGLHQFKMYCEFNTRNLTYILDKLEKDKN